MEYLIVDGYNVINAWKDIFDLDTETLEECRNKLLNILSNYQGYKNINIMVVFDAHMVSGSKEKQELHDNVLVVFTKENETADNFIERYVYKFSNTYRIRVVTSDYLEQTMVLSNGGIRMSPRELKEEIGLAVKDLKVFNKNLSKNNTIMDNVNPDVLAKLEKIRRDRY